MKRNRTLWYKRIAVLALLAAVIGALVWVYVRYGAQILDFVGSPQRVKDWLASFGGWDKPVFVLIRTLQTMAKVIPAEPLEIAAGYVYGTWGGFFLCLLGTELGSLLIVAMVKLFGKRFVNLFVPQEKIDSLRFLQKEDRAWTLLFFLYLLPGTPKDLLTFLVGLTALNVWKFLLFSGVARLPAIISSTWCGAKLASRNYSHALIIFAVIAVTSSAGVIVWRIWHGKKLAKQAAQEPQPDEAQEPPPEEKE